MAGQGQSWRSGKYYSQPGVRSHHFRSSRLGSERKRQRESNDYCSKDSHHNVVHKQTSKGTHTVNGIHTASEPNTYKLGEEKIIVPYLQLTKSSGNWKNLPDVLLGQIFRMLRTKDLENCRRVSRDWRLHSSHLIEASRLVSSASKLRRTPGFSTDKEKIRQAAQVLTKAYSLGYVPAANNIGLIHWSCGEWEQAAMWFSKGAEDGDMTSLSNYGNALYQGKGLAVDLKKSMQCFEMAAWRGNARAQYMLGLCYLTGKGTMKSKTLAERWLTLAARNEYVKAQFNLAQLLSETSTGRSRHSTKSVYWLEQAAKNGHIRAQKLLSECYLYGNGVAKDPKKALEWFERMNGSTNHLCLEF